LYDFKECLMLGIQQTFDNLTCGIDESSCIRWIKVT